MSSQASNLDLWRQRKIEEFIYFRELHRETSTYLAKEEDKYTNIGHTDDSRTWLTLREINGNKYVFRCLNDCLRFGRQESTGRLQELARFALPTNTSIVWVDVSTDGLYVAFILRDLTTDTRVGYYLNSRDGSTVSFGGNSITRAFWSNSGIVFVVARKDGTAEKLQRVRFTDNYVENLFSFDIGSYADIRISNDETTLLISATLSGIKNTFSLDLTTYDSKPSWVTSLEPRSSLRLRSGMLWYLTPGSVNVARQDLSDVSSLPDQINLPEGFIASYLEDAGPYIVVVGRRLGCAACVAIHDDGIMTEVSLPRGSAIRVVPGIDNKKAVIKLSSIAFPLKSIWLDSKANILPNNDVFTSPHINSRRIEVLSFDGTLIPISLFYMGDLSGSRRPCVAHVYGCYGVSLEPSFNPSLLPLLTRGVVFALCHVRGGGEFGPKWHDGGRCDNKLFSIYDFLSCLNNLRRLDFIDNQRIVAQASSAGGYIASSSVGIRPHWFRGLHLINPFLSVLSEMISPSSSRSYTDRYEFGDSHLFPELRDIQSLSSPNQWARNNDVGDLDVWIDSRLNDKVVSWRDNLIWATSLEKWATSSSVNFRLFCNFSSGDHRASFNQSDTGLVNSWLIEILLGHTKLLPKAKADDNSTMNVFATS